ncbi:MAG: serine/threonine-protein kinase [Lentisphaeria bacterium]
MFPFLRQPKRPADPVAEARIRQLQALEAGDILCPKCGARLPPPHPPPLEMRECPGCGTLSLSPLTVGHFWLTEPLGGGGMGSVYLALDSTNPGSACAIKVLARNEKQKIRRMQTLCKEIQVARSLPPHPSLPTFIDGGYDNGEYYLAMELMAGERLDQWVEGRGRLSEAQALLMALHLLAAEQLLFDAGFLYRDLKPENILVRPGGYTALVDYGLVITTCQGANPAGRRLAGSPYFIPPERVMGQPEDARGELYSLGQVLYYALIGQTLYDADEIEDLVIRHVARLRIPLAQKLQKLRPELAAVMVLLMAQQPDKRYPDFATAGAALQALLPTAAA